jgi:hypothetical protein
VIMLVPERCIPMTITGDEVDLSIGSSKCSSMLCGIKRRART